MINEREAEKIEEWLARYEAAADRNLEAAQTQERAVEEFGSQVQNLESAMADDRRRRREFS